MECHHYSDSGLNVLKYSPLYKGRANIGKNIKTEIAAGKSRKQSIAIALSVAGESKKAKKKK